MHYMVVNGHKIISWEVWEGGGRQMITLDHKGERGVDLMITLDHKVEKGSTK